MRATPTYTPEHDVYVGVGDRKLKVDEREDRNAGKDLTVETEILCTRFWRHRRAPGKHLQAVSRRTAASRFTLRSRAWLWDQVKVSF